MHLLSILRDRIERANALVMDLAGHNPNVLLEVGMAVAMKKGESGALIILKPKHEALPSNLQGLVYCSYDKSLRKGLEDQTGFVPRCEREFEGREGEADGQCRGG
jgi:predicted nucleotide-binding protein